MNRIKLLSAVLAIVVTSQAQAGFITIDLSSIVNSNLATYTNGSLYPGPGSINIGGIPFELAAFPGTSSTGVVRIPAIVNTDSG